MKNHHHTICHNGYWEDFSLTSKFSLLANMQIEMARTWEENERLKQDIKDACIVIEKLKKEKKEAIEYIKKDMYVEPKELYGLVSADELLNILGGDKE